MLGYLEIKGGETAIVCSISKGELPILDVEA
jgi:hypothetical protein